MSAHLGAIRGAQPTWSINFHHDIQCWPNRSAINGVVSSKQAAPNKDLQLRRSVPVLIQAPIELALHAAEGFRSRCRSANTQALHCMLRRHQGDDWPLCRRVELLNYQGCVVSE